MRLKTSKASAVRGRGGERKPCFHDEDRKKKKNPNNPKTQPCSSADAKEVGLAPAEGFLGTSRDAEPSLGLHQGPGLEMVLGESCFASVCPALYLACNVSVGRISRSRGCAAGTIEQRSVPSCISLQVAKLRVRVRNCSSAGWLLRQLRSCARLWFVDWPGRRRKKKINQCSSILEESCAFCEWKL